MHPNNPPSGHSPYLCKTKGSSGLDLKDFLQAYKSDPRTQSVLQQIGDPAKRFGIRGLIGSSRSLLAAAVFELASQNHLFILPEKEIAAYFYNDLENLFGEGGADFARKRILFFPTSYKRPYEIEKLDNTNVLLRTEVLNRIGSTKRKTAVVTYPEALCEKVITRQFLSQNTLKLKSGEKISFDFAIELLTEYEFERVDFVVEPGQFSVRGGIIDIFPFSNDYPFRIEFFGDEVDSIRTFDPVSQLSKYKVERITIIPNVQDRSIRESRQSFLEYLPKNTLIWVDDPDFILDQIHNENEKARGAYQALEEIHKVNPPEELFNSGEDFYRNLLNYKLIEFGKHFHFSNLPVIEYDIAPQPSFNKNFELLIKDLKEKTSNRFRNIFFSGNPRQIERIYTILGDIESGVEERIDFSPILVALHEGFIDLGQKLACYTDHQIFERHHRFRLKDSFKSKEAITLKELYDLQPGDYVTHIDHGVGRFDGLEKIDVRGKEQEAIRLTYKNNDLLYISIHSLHRIAKYVGKEGREPQLNKLGTNAWNNLKSRTKKKVKDIARDLIELYAKRRASQGHPYSPDTYLQHELEASFIYEDTPDQVKATRDVKKDLEEEFPMDRLICGDVGFGKTEVAIRTAFKVVSESKQVAVLVPTTILALQHFTTFSERLGDFPVNIDYLNRFKSTARQKETLKKLAAGEIDILIGTHRLLSKDIEFKDLGLLIIDEEQKFGVAAKEKLRNIKVNVDTLTLTATPIPRTLQFSMMGARDLSIINTPPPNRYPVQTEVRAFGEDVIRDGIMYELQRGGQVFFVHNRVQNIKDVRFMLEQFVPDVSVAVAHGQMEGQKLERIMLDFIKGRYDVLLATTIIESGLDIPNVNTIFINDAQNYGLSDLHQLRGRVGRSNKKAFCYLLAPPLSTLTTEARKRLRAIEEFADLGSGFNIAMRDLDIRGAGNILGAEQSGFISEIGFEMYQKILDEAINELKETEFKEVFKEKKEEDLVRDCQIETDMEILLPDDYVSSISVRLSLYKELDSTETEENLMKFQDMLIDRFGPVPPQTVELINTIRLRWKARRLGFEKLILRNEKMTGYFISDQESPYYQSGIFTAVLQFVQQNPRSIRMREAKDKLSLTFPDIKTVYDALHTLQPLVEMAGVDEGQPRIHE
ncbi:MAG: transcription-repair coupling factor [Bacteroidales bacterium]|nr:transcription-repair coupling factor [Bacteroidales bacterium]MCF8344756.1 transcription-repair coupling factor [Bacteroidales bacterium]MCF8352352.1 transcription-repair coupling factor [Bacteroidales bacterium]MCF8377879.1 transcription-repair coupling factor [Bacteroidales bacterium]